MKTMAICGAVVIFTRITLAGSQQRFSITTKNLFSRIRFRQRTQNFDCNKFHAVIGGEELDMPLVLIGLINLLTANACLHLSTHVGRRVWPVICPLQGVPHGITARMSSSSAFVYSLFWIGITNSNGILLSVIETETMAPVLLWRRKNRWEILCFSWLSDFFCQHFVRFSLF